MLSVWRQSSSECSHTNETRFHKRLKVDRNGRDHVTEVRSRGGLEHQIATISVVDKDCKANGYLPCFSLCQRLHGETYYPSSIFTCYCPFSPNYHVLTTSFSSIINQVGVPFDSNRIAPNYSLAEDVAARKKSIGPSTGNIRPDYSGPW